ncbi:MAG: VanW family protein [Patescibacteria group bacterium]|nr:VanW family protein [Patescibacteria group bacterium]
MHRLTNLSRGKKFLAALIGIIGVVLVTLFAIRIAYIGRVMPGVTANGVYLGGLSTQDAIKELNTQTEAYKSQPIEVVALGHKQTISAEQFGVEYDNTNAVQMAMEATREGWPHQRIIDQFVYLIGQGQPITSVDFDNNKLSSVSVDINSKGAKAVKNAQFALQDGGLVVEESQRGNRLDYLRLPGALANHYGMQQKDVFVVPALAVDAPLNTSILESQKNIIAPFEKQPLVLSYGAKSWSIDTNTIISWLTSSSSNQPVLKNILTAQYSLKKPVDTLYYDKKSVSDFISTLSNQINVTPIDAQLTVSGGRATVFRTSQDGRTLDVAKSTEEVMTKLNKGENTPTTLAVSLTKAEVNDENIDKLGINELISEGVSYFPGSPANRIQNIRVGTSKFSNLLIKPGEVFSFNKYLGEVSAATGYAEGIVILENKEEKQYGGGLCQVSSTAYRAALLAGLPILSRTNHAFAVSYYTEPYGVPGVDATIYLPYPDMQFRNDTGSHILIQTELIGTTLKFRFYGTKTKSGVIRGPYFISGDNDHTKPSQTVFYRDVLDLNGNVIKTDTTTTSYKSSLDFPLVVN